MVSGESAARSGATLRIIEKQFKNICQFFKVGNSAIAEKVLNISEVDGNL